MKIALLLFILPLVIGQNYELTELDQSPGLYYDHIGSIRFYDSTWTIVAHTDLKPILSQIEIAKNYCFQLGKDCRSDNNCRGISNNTYGRLQKAEKDIEEFSHLIEGRKISKRNLVNVGMKLAKFLLPIIVENVAGDTLGGLFKKLINGQLDQEDTSLEELSKRVTLLQEKSFKNGDMINKLGANITVMGDELDDLKYSTNVNQLLNQLQHFVIQIEGSITEIRLCILSGKSNEIHPSVVSIEQFQSELRSLKKFLPKDVDYILPLTMENVQKIREISVIRMYHTGDMIIYEIILPLVKRTVFNGYNILPLPIKSSEGYISINPSTEFLAVSQSKEEYVILKSFSHCLDIDENEMICVRNGPVYKSHKSPICEVTLLINNIISESCSIQKTLANLETFEKLHMPNRWLYVTSNPITMSIHCGGNVKYEQFINTGILQITSECDAFSENVQLHGGRPLNFTKLSSVIPRVNILDDNCCSSFLKTLKPELLKENSLKTSLKLFHDISIPLNEYASLSTTNIILIVFGVFIVLGLISATTYMFLWFRKEIKSFRNDPEVVPERRNNQSRLSYNIIKRMSNFTAMRDVHNMDVIAQLKTRQDNMFK